METLEFSKRLTLEDTEFEMVVLDSRDTGIEMIPQQVPMVEGEQTLYMNPRKYQSELALVAKQPLYQLQAIGRWHVLPSRDGGFPAGHDHRHLKKASVFNICCRKLK